MKIAHYGTATPKQIDLIERRISETIVCQSSLVDMLLHEEILSFDDCLNLIKEGEEEDECGTNYKEIFQWFYIMDSWLKNKLIEIGEPVLDTDYGAWWGRCCCGQSISLDPTFWEIFKLPLEEGQK